MTIAALNANTALQMRNTTGKLIRNCVVKTSAVIYKHAIVVLNAAGKGIAAADLITTTFFGIAEDGPVTGDGTKTVNCIDGCEVLMLLKTGITVGHTGVIIGAFNDASVYRMNVSPGLVPPASLAVAGPQIGTLTQFVAANSGWVLLRGASMSASV